MNPAAALERIAKQHARAAISALGRLRRHGLGSLMTAGAIGVALALPAAFLVAMDNLESVMGDWQGAPRASAFLAMDTDARQHEATAERIAGLTGIGNVRLITPEAGLAAYRAHNDMDDALELLEDNPLPAVVEATLDTAPGAVAIDRLVRRLEGLPRVERVRVDREWIQRLAALLALGHRITALVAVLLGMTVVLVLFNTIRLDIENNRREIEITQLIGGTNGFIRRPFLYTGLWYGLGGGLIAGLILAAAMAFIAPAAGGLAARYGSDFAVSGAGFTGTLTLIGTGGLLGLGGAWLAVGRQLAAIEPG
jgi:cell division transport system permease protein